MIDVTVPETFTLTISLEDGKRGDGGGGEYQLQNIKKVFANAVKNAIHGDSTSNLSLLLKLPYFITVAGVCEVCHIRHSCAKETARKIWNETILSIYFYICYLHRVL